MCAHLLAISTVHAVMFALFFFCFSACLYFYSAPIGQRGVLRWACLCLCLSVQDHIFGTTRPSLNLLCMLPTTVVWVLLWRSTDTLCTSDHTDDVIFAHIPRLLDVGPSRSAAHTQPWVWLWTVRSNINCRPTDARDFFRALKVTPQVATQGAESAVYDCLVLSASIAVSHLTHGVANLGSRTAKEQEQELSLAQFA